MSNVKMFDGFTAIIPEPVFMDFPRTEIHGDDIPELQRALRQHLSETGHGASDVGSKFYVYRDGARVGTLMYNGVYHVREELKDHV